MRDIITIGASAGGISALKTLVADLPADFDAVVCIVQHVSPESPGILPQILNWAGKIRASFPADNEAPEAGRIYVAPPGLHMLFDGNGRLRLSRGPKENRARPAIDPLFRSAAVVFGPRVVGVILSGYLNDGSSGLAAIALAGGVALVQQPSDAEVPEMPQSALRWVRSAQSVPLKELAAELVSIVGTEVGDSPMPEEKLLGVRLEAAIAAGDKASLIETQMLGRPSALSCPDCHGSLFQLDADPGLQRFRCHTGHAFTAETLLVALRESTENATWNAIRTFQEQAILLRHMATHAEANGEAERAAVMRTDAGRAEAASHRLREFQQE